LPEFYISVWSGMWAPKGTPADIVLKLNSAIGTALADEAVQRRRADLGQDIPPRDELRSTRKISIVGNKEMVAHR
jgi:tripartite-type tricarboxylate transporter receptor subunit TctC